MIIKLKCRGDFVHRIYPIELEIKDTTNTARCASHNAHDLSPNITFNWILIMSNKTGATSGARTAHPSGAPESIFSWVHELNLYLSA